TTAPASRADGAKTDRPTGAKSTCHSQTVEVRLPAESRAADASQAAYFRVALTDERQTVTAALDQAETRLRACVERQELVGLRGMARARLQVRELKHQVLQLDRMIAALDRRYSASWSDGR
ncbi:hypothetical protein, partial [Mycolicibacterium agri]|uniref:hypothetical protein n=1 Tax=Mycolicibacterium agri TaxID=36811 RepID=UPI001A9C9EE2